MSKSVQSDVYVEIEDYINQLWSLDGTVSRSISPATRMKLYTYVFYLFWFSDFSLFLIFSLIYNYIMDPPKQNMPHWSWRDKAGAHLYHHIGSFFQEKVKNAYEVSVFLFNDTEWVKMIVLQYSPMIFNIIDLI